MARNDRAGKAALLTELLGEARVSHLRKTGVLPKAAPEEPDADSVAWHRNRLIERFRERGLLPGGAAKASAGASKPGKPPARNGERRSAPEFTPGGIGARLAKHLDPERLADEHPAVIALFLRSQTPQLRSRVLRGLPGGQARAVMRILRAGVDAASQSQSPKQLNEAATRTPDTPAAPAPKPRAPHAVRTRRAR